MLSLILIIVGCLLIMIPDYIKYTDNEIAMKIYRNNKVIGVSCMIMGYFMYTDMNETNRICTISDNMISDDMINNNMISDDMINNNMISDNTISNEYFSST